MEASGGIMEEEKNGWRIEHFLTGRGVKNRQKLTPSINNKRNRWLHAVSSSQQGAILRTKMTPFKEHLQKRE
jgi:hypothetical protein